MILTFPPDYFRFFASVLKDATRERKREIPRDRSLEIAIDK